MISSRGRERERDKERGKIFRIILGDEPCFPHMGCLGSLENNRIIFGAMMQMPCPMAWTGALFTG